MVTGLRSQRWSVLLGIAGRGGVCRAAQDQVVTPNAPVSHDPFVQSLVGSVEHGFCLSPPVCLAGQLPGCSSLATSVARNGVKYACAQ